MEKICKASSRATMCPRVRAHVDAQLEQLALLHTAFGTGGYGDAVTKKALREKESVLYREIKKVAPNYYKRISIDK